MAKIVIDAGHGKYTAGKRCLKSLDRNETREWVLNARVADALEKYLSSAGHIALRVDDISGNTDVPLATRIKMANEWKADYYVSIHHNAGINGGRGGGTIVFAYPGIEGKTIEAQEKIYKHAVERAGLKGNRSDGMLTADFFVLRETRMPASLVECGFMDSSTDIRYILNPEWSKSMARGIAEGICEVFGGTVKEEVAEKVKIMPAKNFDTNFAGAYTATTSNLNLRAGAGVAYDVIDVIPENGKVQCYGYYTKDVDETIWLYVVYNGQVGFVSKRYLLK